MPQRVIRHRSHCGSRAPLGRDDNRAKRLAAHFDFRQEPFIGNGYKDLDSANSVEFLTMHGMFVVPSTRAEKS
jgi:hypothetical protein